MGIRQKALIEINGKTYMSPGAAHDKWGDISTQKVVSECKKGKIIGACCDSSGKWIIPIDATHPLDDEDIRILLVSLLCIKNKPQNDVEQLEEKNLISVLEYLKKIGYVEGWNTNERVDLASVVITEKGMGLATKGTTINIDWKNAGITLIQVIGSIISIWKAF